MHEKILKMSYYATKIQKEKKLKLKQDLKFAYRNTTGKRKFVRENLRNSNFKMHNKKNTKTHKKKLNWNLCISSTTAIWYK